MFIIKKRIPTTPTVSARKKQKVDNYKGAIPLILIEGDIDEIGDKVKEVTIETWERINNHYRVLL